MGWNDNKPKEKFVYMPFETVTHLWNSKTEMYEPVQHAPKKSKPVAPSPIKGPFQKDRCLPNDHPAVMFKGLPLALAVRKKEELEKQYPGLSGDQLVGIKKQLDAGIVPNIPLKNGTTKEAKPKKPTFQPNGSTKPAALKASYIFFPRATQNAKSKIRKVPVKVKKPSPRGNGGIGPKNMKLNDKE
ncbi:hypothetical protein VTO42DRAFT_1066 [Malbranchea cinnamomea]